MSWDLMIVNIPSKFQSTQDIPQDIELPIVGIRQELIDKIIEYLPEINFEGPSWGVYRTEEFLLEFSMGETEQCDCIMLHLRGSENAMKIVLGLLTHLNARGIDMQTGEFFSSEQVQKSMERFNKFKQQFEHDKQQVIKINLPKQISMIITKRN